MRFPEWAGWKKRFPSNRRTVGAALVGVVVLACAGWAAASQIRSPAQIAADTAAPKASLISVPVERRSLATEVIVRGTVRYGKPQAIALPVSGLKSNTQVVSRPAQRDAQLRDGAVAMTVSGRPVFVLQGQTPMHRDLGPGDGGTDVMQLERALARLGHHPGPSTGATTAPRGRPSPSCIAATTRRRSGSPTARARSSAPPPQRSPRRATACCRRASPSVPATPTSTRHGSTRRPSPRRCRRRAPRSSRPARGSPRRATSGGSPAARSAAATPARGATSRPRRST